MRIAPLAVAVTLFSACPPMGGNDGGSDDAGNDAGCVPQCGSRVCGTESSCGTSCGSCAQTAVCSAAGQCVAPTPFTVTTGGSGDDAAFSVATDLAGNSYLTGYFAGAISLGDHQLVSQAPRDVFIAKVSRDGAYLWATAVKGTGIKQAQSIAVDQSGAVFVSGFFTGQAVFGSQTITATGARDLFVTKLNANGEFEWTFTAGGANAQMAGRVAVSQSGAIYVAGTYDNTVNVGGIMLTSVAQSPDVLVVRLNADGVPTWAVSAGGSEPDEARGVAVTSGDGVAIGGTFGGSATFGSQMLTTQGFAGAFAAKLDAQGVYTWATGCNSSTLSDTIFGWAMNMDTNQNIYVTGQVNGTVSCSGKMMQSVGGEDAFVVKFNSTGAVDWAKSAGGQNTDVGWTVAVNSSGVGLVGGEFEGAATFGPHMVTSKGASDGFAARFDAAGNFTQVHTFGGALAADVAFGVAWLPWLQPLVVGSFEKTTLFGNATRTSAGGSDFFVWAP
ncbi:MAG: hypothetical protein K1X64_04230 [Myxococcaceae bacterium]|nr:hypothetical protein [Myxococcaceae bacterium]